MSEPPPVGDNVVAAWNAQADEHNQWDTLSDAEKQEWITTGQVKPPAVHGEGERDE